MGKINRNEKGMLLIETILIFLMVLAIMRAGFETYLHPFKKSLERVSSERIPYHGKILWRD
ncbi:MAG: hypothetical protein EBQ92_08815 [Proteobacteria bacterium]|nr:hypothetical protein [Pseudomonadota bacterium]